MTNGISNVEKGQNFWSNGFSAGLWSAASTAITMGIGGALGDVGGIYKELGRAGAHALSNGTTSYLQGGNFWRGAASGFVSSGTGSLLDGASADIQLMGSATSGGLTSLIGGGSFWQGFGIGFTVAAFNHLVDHGDSEGPDDPPKVGDVKYESGQYGSIIELTYTDEGWKVTSITPGSGASQITDSPIEWVLNAWRAPFQAADDISVLGFAKFGGGKAGTVFLQGIGAVGKEGYHTIKSNILTKVGKINYTKVVGTNPDIIGQNGHIYLKATAPHLNGKTMPTNIKISDHF